MKSNSFTVAWLDTSLLRNMAPGVYISISVCLYLSLSIYLSTYLSLNLSIGLSAVVAYAMSMSLSVSTCINIYVTPLACRQLDIYMYKYIRDATGLQAAGWREAAAGV